MATYGFAKTNVATAPLPASYMPRAYDVTISPAEVAAATTAEQTFTVTGLSTSDAVVVNKPTTDAGLGIAGARVSAANTLAITFINATAGALTPTAAQTYKIIAFKVS